MGKIFSKIRGLISKLFVLIAVILVALAVIYSGSPVEVFGITLKAWQLGMLAAIALGLAYVVDGDQASKMLGSIASGAKDIVNKTGEVLGSAASAAGDAVGSSLSSWILPIGAILGVYYVYSNIKGEDSDNQE